MIDAPDSRNNLHPICIENAFSAGSVACPFRVVLFSAVRKIPGVLNGVCVPFPPRAEGISSLPAAVSLV